MSRYASETAVPVERSRAEIEETLKRYGASSFQTGWNPRQAMIGFEVDNLHVRFTIPMPDPDDKRLTHKKVYGRLKPMSDLQKSRAYDQELRQRWRALLLVVKAKLEAVECGISTREQEFLAFVVLPNDQTVMQWMATDVLPMIRGGEMPRLALPAPEKPKINDAEQTA